MRCRICDGVHRTTQRHKLWREEQLCRACAFLLEIFSLNNNRLREYYEQVKAYSESRWKTWKELLE